MLARGIERNRRDIHLGHNILFRQVETLNALETLLVSVTCFDLVLSRSMSRANRKMDFDIRKSELWTNEDLP